MNANPRAIGRRLRAAREARNLSQAVVAGRAGLSREHVARLEGGRYDPTISTLARLAKALRVRMNRLLGD